MRLSVKIALARKVLEARVFNKRIPLLVNWEITKQCNAKCKYCNIWNNASEELDIGQVNSIIQELSFLGTRMIHFTGGEPLLRKDIGMILDYCHKKNILTAMNSNGSLVPARINEIATLHLLSISLDGPEEVHDHVRGKGSYRKAIEAITAARDKGIELRLLAVLSECNLHVVDFLLEKAEEFSAPVIFQPATKFLLGAEANNPIVPDVEKYKQVIKKLLVKKKKGLLFTKEPLSSVEVDGINLYLSPPLYRAFPIRGDAPYNVFHAFGFIRG